MMKTKMKQKSTACQIQNFAAKKVFAKEIKTTLEVLLHVIRTS